MVHTTCCWNGFDLGPRARFSETKTEFYSFFTNGCSLSLKHASETGYALDRSLNIYLGDKNKNQNFPRKAELPPVMIVVYAQELPPSNCITMKFLCGQAADQHIYTSEGTRNQKQGATNWSEPEQKEICDILLFDGITLMTPSGSLVTPDPILLYIPKLTLDSVHRRFVASILSDIITARGCQNCQIHMIWRINLPNLDRRLASGRAELDDDIQRCRLFTSSGMNEIVGEESSHTKGGLETSLFRNLLIL